MIVVVPPQAAARVPVSNVSEAAVPLEDAPDARVAIVGYPAVAPTDGTNCYPVVPLSPDDLAYIFDHAEDKILLIDETMLPLLDSFRDEVNLERIFVIPTAPHRCQHHTRRDTHGPHADRREVARGGEVQSHNTGLGRRVVRLAGFPAEARDAGGGDDHPSGPGIEALVLRHSGSGFRQDPVGAGQEDVERLREPAGRIRVALSVQDSPTGGAPAVHDDRRTQRS